MMNKLNDSSRPHFGKGEAADPMRAQAHLAASEPRPPDAEKKGAALADGAPCLYQQLLLADLNAGQLFALEQFERSTTAS